MNEEDLQKVESDIKKLNDLFTQINSQKEAAGIPLLDLAQAKKNQQNEFKTEDNKGNYM